MKKKYAIYQISGEGHMVHPEDEFNKYREQETNFEQLFDSEEEAIQYAKSFGITYFFILTIYTTPN